jgi:hypothetical protein
MPPHSETMLSSHKQIIELELAARCTGRPFHRSAEGWARLGAAGGPPRRSVERRGQEISEPFFSRAWEESRCQNTARASRRTRYTTLDSANCRTKIFTARPILQRLLEGAKTRSALYIDGFFSAPLICSFCWRCSKCLFWTFSHVLRRPSDHQVLMPC